MKDADSTPEKPESADDMSLADLLGGGGEAEPESPRRVEHRADEPDSGMVNLAKMVAASSVDVAKTPSLAPPPPPVGEGSGARPMPAADPSGMIATQMAPAAAAPAPRSNAAIYALIAIVVVAAAGFGVFFATRGGDAEQQGADQAALDKAAEMMAKLEAKAEAERKAAAEERAMLMAKLEEMSKTAGAGGAVSAEEQAKMDAVKAQIEEAAAKEEAAAQKAAEAKTDKPKKEPSSSGDSAAAPKKETAKADTAKSSSSEKAAAEKKTEPAAKSGSSTEELDSLLGSSKKEEPKAAATEKPASDLPKQLSKEQVKAGMAPVQAKAQAMCAKKSTGTVTIQLVISGEGKVKSATPTGIWANNDAGKCVNMIARTAKFPKFSDPSMTVASYPIVLQ